MQNKKQSEATIEELLSVAKQLVLLIEDNNQNVKDCARLLKTIQDKVCPKTNSKIKSLVRKILNTK